MTATPPFRFKQFVVHQEHAAMKVGFDGILLGAWVDVSGANRILDVGTGTGLIALMLAQRTPCAEVDAIDIDAAAAREAAENFQVSTWMNRLSVEHVALQEFVQRTGLKYDLIVCNPPFYEGGHKLSSQSREVARHDDALCLADLIALSSKSLATTGSFALILPIEREKACNEIAFELGLHLSRQMYVRPNPDSAVHRVLSQFGRERVAQVRKEEMEIELERHIYSERFRELAREFYLRF